MIYLDDILIYSNNMSEHHQHVKEVLKRLHKAGLYAKAEKYEFHSESVEYLGYILSPSGFTMSDDKIKIIQDWPEPKKVKDIQSFLGFANFYCRFIFNYLDIVIPLTCLTRKNIPWKFDSSCQDAFNSLKKAFTSALSQTSFSLYLHNQWTDFHKLSCAGKPQMRAIRTYAGCTKATTND